MFLDAEKAFDRVRYDGLIHKLHKLGTPLQLIKIIMSFLNNRSFKVRVEGTLSDNRLAPTGVPQSSCLSPLLYLVYTNDIPTTPKASVVLFADDTLFHTTDKNSTRAIIQQQHQLNLAIK